MIRIGNLIGIIFMGICFMCLWLWLINGNMRAFWMMFITLGIGIWFFSVTNEGEKYVDKV